MTKTLVLLFHPDLTRSKANAALAYAAAALPGVEVINMLTVSRGGFNLFHDSASEAARLLAADRIVLQFPVQWYSIPPLMKAWQDAVLTRMFYAEYETEGRYLEGKPVMIAATAGNTLEAYTPGGRNMFTMSDLFAPLRATAHRCGLIWSDPFVIYRADKLSLKELEAVTADYAAVLSRWIVTSTQRAV